MWSTNPNTSCWLNIPNGGVNLSALFFQLYFENREDSLPRIIGCTFYAIQFFLSHQIFFALQQIFVSPWRLVFFLCRTRSVSSPVLSRRWSACTIFRPASLFCGNLILSQNLIMRYCTFFKADLIGCWSSLGSLAGTVVTTLVGTWVSIGLKAIWLGWKLVFVAEFQDYFKSN